MTDAVKLLMQVLGTSALTVLVTLGALFLLRTAIAGLVTKSINTDLEKLRADMNSKLEFLRHELQKEAQKAEVLTAQKSNLYPGILNAARTVVRLARPFAETTRTPLYTSEPEESEFGAAVSAYQNLLEAGRLHMGPQVLQAANAAVIAFAAFWAAAKEASNGQIPEHGFRLGQVDEATHQGLHMVTEALGELDVQMRSELHPTGPLAPHP